jgi:sugar lactone lactonase YvrE
MVGLSTDAVYQYSLSTAYDLSTISYDSVSFSVSSQDLLPIGISFNADGTKMFILGDTNDTVFQYSLTTGFDLSSASYDSVSFSVSSQNTGAHGIDFSSDGTKMFISGDSNDTVYQYTLSTGFDLTTASYDSVSFSVATQDKFPESIRFNPDGTKMFMVGRDTDAIYQYSLSTAYDLSTASYDSVSFSVTSQLTNPRDVIFRNDGAKMYVTGSSTDAIFQYSTD